MGLRQWFKSIFPLHTNAKVEALQQENWMFRVGFKHYKSLTHVKQDRIEFLTTTNQHFQESNNRLHQYCVEADEHIRHLGKELEETYKAACPKLPFTAIKGEIQETSYGLHTINLEVPPLRFAFRCDSLITNHGFQKHFAKELARRFANDAEGFLVEHFATHYKKD